MIVRTLIGKLGAMLAVIRVQQQSCYHVYNLLKEKIMWTKPEATEMRFGFEVTMYVCNR